MEALARECLPSTQRLSEKDEVTLIIKRQRVARLLTVELSLRKLLGISESEEWVMKQERRIAEYSKSKHKII